MLDAIIKRAEAARSRYLARLADPNLRAWNRHRHQGQLSNIELRLADLRAHRKAWEETA
jgi:hypothetical protein